MMRLRICVDQVDTHVHMRVFVNGALAGKLILRYEEYIPFWGLLLAGEAAKKAHYKVEFKDDLFWEKYEGEMNYLGEVGQ